MTSINSCDGCMRVYRCCHGVNVCRGNHPLYARKHKPMAASIHSSFTRSHDHTCTQLNPPGQPVPVNLQLYLFQCSWLRARLPGPPGPARGHVNPRDGRRWLGHRKRRVWVLYLLASSRLRSNTSTDMHINK